MKITEKFLEIVSLFAFFLHIKTSRVLQIMKKFFDYSV